MKTETKYILFLTVFYFIVSYVGILHHELLLDEAHHWLLARDSASISDLIHNTRIEGHPITWSLILYALTRFTADPFWMQFLHILISTSVTFLFLRKAPFSLLFKTLFIFGYFFIFEYNLISRNYSLGVLFLFLACAAFENREKNFLQLCFFLAMAANIHLMFSVIAFAFFLTLLLENYANRNLLQRKFLLGYLVFIVGLLSIIIQIQHTDSGWLLDPIHQLSIQERLVKGFVALFKGLVMIPDFRTLYFWNSNFIVNTCRSLSAILAVLVYFLPLFLFYKNRKTLFFVYVGLIGTQVFFFITQRGGARFHGMTFLIIFMALWMEHYYRSEAFGLKTWMPSFPFMKFKKGMVYSILLLQFCSGVYAYTIDYRYPFTSASAAVDFLKNEKLDHREIITVTCDGTLISTYLQRKIYFLCDGGYQSFCHWNNPCVGLVSEKKTIAMLNDFMIMHENIVFVSYYSLEKTLQPNVWMNLNDKIKVRFLKKFDLNMVDKTNYFIFEVAKIKN